MMSKLAIAISTFMRKEGFDNRFTIFKDCINTFCQTDFEGTLHLVDDDSETKEHLHWVGQKKDKRIIVHQKPTNGGVARTKNTCIRLCLQDKEVDTFFLSDDDMVFKTNEWYKIYAEAVNGTDIQHFSYALPSCARKKAKPVSVRGENLLITPHVNGCFLVCTRKLIESIGYFKILPYKYGHEHSNFSVRSRKHTGQFFDVESSSKHLELNPASHDNKSVVVNKEEMEANSKFVWQVNKEKCIE